MPKIRDILSHVSVEVAGRRRICHRNRADHSIDKGTRCLVITDPATGGGKNYCPECAPEILNKAKLRIAELEKEL
jgi:hypothetical protein